MIEVNDNPNVDAGNEDARAEDALYREVMGVFLRRIQERKRAAHMTARWTAAGVLPATASSSST